jgi:FkbM family methyltransferase
MFRRHVHHDEGKAVSSSDETAFTRQGKAQSMSLRMKCIVTSACAFVVAYAAYSENLWIGHSQTTVSTPTPTINNTRTVANTLLASSVRKLSGNGWQVPIWDEPTELPVGNWSCRWTDFKATNGKKSKMCVHWEDGISNGIVKSGRNAHCDSLTGLWEKHYKEVSIYMEIGANVGSCVMQMLLTTNASIIAFEPHPANLYVLMSTMLQMSKEYQDRLLLFPVALGAQQGNSTIHAAKGNMGNSAVGMGIKDNSRQQLYEAISIQVEKLDDLMTSTGPVVSLTKMDAQGFECNILEGATKGGTSRILERTKAIKYEFARKWLEAQQCFDLLHRFNEVGFQNYQQGSQVPIPDGEKVSRNMVEIIALNKKDL